MTCFPWQPQVAALALVFGSSAAADVVPQIVVSTSDAATLPGLGGADDEELLVVAPGQVPRKFLNDQTLALYFGDRDGNGVIDEPNDVDALELVGVAAGTPVVAGVYFSLLTDQSGIKDGDVLRFDPGDVVDGLEIAYSEQSLVAAIGAVDGNIDVDALAFGADGSLWFSLAEDEATGPSSVIVQDEAIWQWAPGAAAAAVAVDGVQIEAWLATALGTATAAGDVMSIEFAGSDLLFTVQSPSLNDATVFSSAAGGSIYAGAAESTLGFGNNIEVDALALNAGPVFPCLDLDTALAAEGTPVAAALAGLTPGQPFVALIALSLKPAGGLGPFAGFGAIALDPADALFIGGILNAPALAGLADAAGRGGFGGNAPLAGLAAYDLGIQVLDLGSGRVSNPVLLEVNQ